MVFPTFSIITVTYNASDCLEKTIKSIVNQSYPNIEYILVDGASTDGTIDIIKQYEANVSYWMSEPDTGLYDAMNKGLQKATGDYIWFVNAGDLLYSDNTVEKIAALIEEGGVIPDIIYGDSMIIDEHGNELGLRRLRPPRKLTWKSFKKGMLVSHQSFIVKCSLAPLYNLTYKYSSDFDWCIRCMKKAQNILNTKLILSDFLDGGLSTIQRKSSLKERYRIMCNYYGKASTMMFHLWFAIRFYSAKWFRGRV